MIEGPYLLESFLDLRSKCVDINVSKEVEKNVRKQSIYTNPKERIRAHRVSESSKATTLFLTK